MRISEIYSGFKKNRFRGFTTLAAICLALLLAPAAALAIEFQVPESETTLNVARSIRWPGWRAQPHSVLSHVCFLKRSETIVLIHAIRLLQQWGIFSRRDRMPDLTGHCIFKIQGL